MIYIIYVFKNGQWHEDCRATNEIVAKRIARKNSLKNLSKVVKISKKYKETIVTYAKELAFK